MIPEIAIVCDRDTERKVLIQTVELLAARLGFDISICCAGNEMEESREGLSEEKSSIYCVILSWSDRETAFAHAERLWNREPSLPVIYVAHRAEDIFAALGMPFFHMVRIFNLEEDLRAAFRKLGRLKNPSTDRVSFVQNGKHILVSRKEIIYLESEHHDIRLHAGADVFPISETLSQCEEKLKGMGFVRIYRSFLVNMYHIRCLERENVLLDNGERLFVSRRRYPEVKLQFEKYIRHLDFLS